MCVTDSQGKSLTHMEALWFLKEGNSTIILNIYAVNFYQFIEKSLMNINKKIIRETFKNNVKQFFFHLRF